MPCDTWISDLRPPGPGEGTLPWCSGPWSVRPCYSSCRSPGTQLRLPPRTKQRFRPVGGTPESELKAGVHPPGQTAPERRTGHSCPYLGSGHPPASSPAKQEVPRDYLPAFAASPGAQSGSRRLCGQQAECGACREPGT